VATKLYRNFRKSPVQRLAQARLNSGKPARHCRAAQAFNWSQTMRHPLLTLATLAALWAPLTLHAPLVLAATAEATTTSSTSPQARVIVKFKADALSLRKQILSATNSAAQMHTARAESLGVRTGLALRGGMGVAERTQVMFASGMTSAQLAETLSKDGDVEYAVPDERKRRMVAPNDSLYFAGPLNNGPASGQWYLRPNSGAVKSSIDVEPAWAITTGSPSVVVAVLDSGIRFDHADMQRTSAGGNLLPGFDMVSDLGAANDGDGRDGDPSDPGDWVTAAEANLVGSEFYKCTTLDPNTGRYVAESSSWHGTQTAGLIGASTNNGIGMASVGRAVKVLPVRVLGKCGGFDSDIIAGMRWAAGLSVAGVPTNATPARVINMSLGGSGVCSPAYKNAVAEVNAAGVVVVASAGNSAGHAVSSPANCPGVIAVAALRHVGTKVGFSDLGPEITISAPGGNCVNTAQNTPCLYPILTTDNGGTTVPLAGSSSYSDSYNYSLGTSFSAPLVSGTVGLMLSARPSLSPAEVMTLLKGTARAFPTTGGDNGNSTVVAQCVAPKFDAAGKPIDQEQCYCTTSTCGAGMLDAGVAVTLSTQVVLARISVSPESPTADQVVTLSAAPSLTAPGRSIASYAWTLNDGGGIVTGFNGATNAASATVSPRGAGSFIATLTVVDDSPGGGARSTTPVTINVGPTPVLVGPPVSGDGGGGGGGAIGGLWLALLALAAALVYRSRPKSIRI
jgi:serine protease